MNYDFCYRQNTQIINSIQKLCLLPIELKIFALRFYGYDPFLRQGEESFKLLNFKIYKVFTPWHEKKLNQKDDDTLKMNLM